MTKVFLIPGLGADSRIYSNIELEGYDIIPVNWIEPDVADTLSSYAQKLIDEYNILPDSIVIGNSMGGMIAIEIAKTISLSKIILISSIRTVREAPDYFKFFRKFPVYKLIPGSFFTSVDFLLKPIFGHLNPEDSWLFRDMLKKSSPVFVKWAMGAILHWDNQVIPSNVYQVSGDKDRLFPYRKLKDAEIIKDGTHIMIFENAAQINDFLKRTLEK